MGLLSIHMDKNERAVPVPVLLPDKNTAENYTAEFPESSQTVQNYKKAQNAVVHVAMDSIDLRHAAKYWSVDKELVEELIKEQGGQKQSSFATGFFITSDGWLVTSRHVACLKADLSAEWPDGQKVKLRRVYQDRKTDIAILKLDSANQYKVPFLPLAKNDSLSPSETLTMVGYPNTWKNLHCSPGNLVGLGRRNDYLPNASSIKLITDTKNSLMIMRTSCHDGPGGSGSPTLNSLGEVVGITFAGPPSDDKEICTYAIPVKELRKAIQHVPELRERFLELKPTRR